MPTTDIVQTVKYFEVYTLIGATGNVIPSAPATAVETLDPAFVSRQISTLTPKNTKLATLSGCTSYQVLDWTGKLKIVGNELQLADTVKNGDPTIYYKIEGYNSDGVPGYIGQQQFTILNAGAPTGWWETSADYDADFANNQYKHVTGATVFSMLDLFPGATRDGGGIIMGPGIQRLTAGLLKTFLNRSVFTISLIWEGKGTDFATLLSPAVSAEHSVVNMAGANVGMDFNVSGPPGTTGTAGVFSTTFATDGAIKKLSANGVFIGNDTWKLPFTSGGSENVYVGNSKFGDQPFGGPGSLGRLKRIILWEDAAIPSNALLNARSLFGI